MEFQVTINQYSKRGHGLGSVQKTPNSPPSPIEVVGTVVGDTISCILGKKKKKIYSGVLLNILNPSADRETPRCKHVGSCGGCSWQQKKYEAQLKAKQEQITSLFPIEPLPIIPCDDPWEYRNKMEYTFSQNKEGEKFLGLIIARSRGKVLNLEECHLTPPWFIAVLTRVRCWWETTPLRAYHAHTDQGTLRTLTLREGKRTGDKMAFLTISGNHDYCINKTELEGFKKAVRKALPGEDPSLFLRIQRIAKGKPTEFYEMHLGGKDLIEETLIINKKKLHFKISPDSFFQPNPKQGEKLFTKALEIASPKPTDTLFDLYCGTGTLSVIFAPYVKRVRAIELNPYATCDAQLNIEANGLTNISLYQEDVGAHLAQVSAPPDIVVIDPPRSGLDPKALKNLIRLAPKKILYISCNPKTQSENISDLILHGYTLKILQGIDQFPHTVHLETITLLEKT